MNPPTSSPGRFSLALQIWKMTNRKNYSILIPNQFSVVSGAAYGNGVYFAANASYSMDFTAPDSNKLRHMYLARVVVGFYVKGRKGLLVPPPLSPEVPEVLFDSVVDRESNPRTFVVFKDSQCYPEYLITFS